VTPAIRSAQDADDGDGGGRHTSEGIRVRMGSSACTDMHILAKLALDPSLTVRAAVAMNPACPPHVDEAMSRDPDERVRALLASKLARLAPMLCGADQARACGQMAATLRALAADTAIRVRAAVAECVKAMPNAPRSLILALAQDEALPVSEPVIRLSPLLTDADLLALLVAPAHPGVPVAIASRPGLSATVADAVAARTDGAAIRALLCNQSAAIREATLDALIGQAEPFPGWHSPLVHRPALTPAAAIALAGFVASHLVDVLAARTDIGPEVAAQLRGCLAARVQAAAGAPTLLSASLPTSDEADQLISGLRKLEAAGALNEATLLDAARAGDHRRVAAVLTVASGLPAGAVERAATLRDAKALVTLVWKAGFSMRAAAVVQAMLGQLGPGAALGAGADGGPPLSRDELEWQLERLQH